MKVKKPAKKKVVMPKIGKKKVAKKKTPPATFGTALGAMGVKP